MIDCKPATGQCLTPSSGPCLPIYPRSAAIPPLKELKVFPSVDGAAITWKIDTPLTPPDQSVLIRAKNLTTGLMQQLTATVHRGDGVGYIDFIPNANVGDHYDLYLRAHTDTAGGHWQKIGAEIKALTGAPQVVQSVVTRHNPHQILVIFDRPVTVGGNFINNAWATKNGATAPMTHAEVPTSMPHSALLFNIQTPTSPTDVLTWTYLGNGELTTPDGGELAAHTAFPIINNSKFEGRAFSDGFSLGFL